MFSRSSPDELQIAPGEGIKSGVQHAEQQNCEIDDGEEQRRTAVELHGTETHIGQQTFGRKYFVCKRQMGKGQEFCPFAVDPESQKES